MQKQIIPQEKILLIWTKTLAGIKLRKEMNESRQRYESNPHFCDVAEAMQNELRAPRNAKLALWSGGYDVSEYARLKKNCTTLESTILVGAFDTLELYSDWKCIGPLWNSISRKYVEQGKGAWHVFLRVHAPDSVLYRQEIPMLAYGTDILSQPGKWNALGLSWHALFGDGSWRNLKEVNDQGELVEDHVFPSEHVARMAIKNFLVRRSQNKQSSTFASRAMKID